LIYLLDTNVLSDLVVDVENVSRQFSQAIAEEHTLCLCHPILYELRRGLIWRKNTTKYSIFNEKILPRLILVPLTDADWQQAAQLWVYAVSRGKQHSDIDLLIAAIAKRLEASLVTGDNDFDTLPIQRVNWRNTQPS